MTGFNFHNVTKFFVVEGPQGRLRCHLAVARVRIKYNEPK